MGGAVCFCRKRCAAAGFKPLQSRAFDRIALLRIVWARDSFPAFGEAKIGVQFVSACAASPKSNLPSPKAGRVASRASHYAMSKVSERDDGRGLNPAFTQRLRQSRTAPSVAARQLPRKQGGYALTFPSRELHSLNCPRQARHCALRTVHCALSSGNLNPQSYARPEWESPCCP